jgi:hypothetical protein
MLVEVRYRCQRLVCDDGDRAVADMRADGGNLSFAGAAAIRMSRTGDDPGWTAERGRARTESF